ncbi:MAG: hypothetical protein P9L99_08385 [Candidatus Lernaella stagnicola]|nr:hypothetical protein [Candidatus Lernaella stagnicola]
MSKAIHQRKYEGGFTLAELVVGTFLVTVGLLSLAAVMSTVANRQEFSVQMTSMTNLASTKLESIKDVLYDDIESSEEGFGSIADFPAYKREVVVTPNEEDTLKVVEVKIYAAKGQQISIQTVIAR